MLLRCFDVLKGRVKRMLQNQYLLSIWKERSSEYRRLLEAIQKQAGPMALFGISESAAMHMIAALSTQIDMPILLLVNDEKEAVRLTDEFSTLTDDVVHMPAREIILHTYIGASHQISNQRVTALNAIYEKKVKICVASVDAFLQAMAPADMLKNARWTLELGDIVDLENLPLQMMKLGYERVEQITGSGQFAIRGAIFDVFSPNKNDPMRIEFFDDEIDSIRNFDVSTQRSLQKFDKIIITSANEVPLNEKSLQRALKILQNNQQSDGPIRQRLENLKSSIENKNFIEGIEQLIPLFYEPHYLIDHMIHGCLCIALEMNQIEERMEQTLTLFAETFAQSLEADNALPFQADLLMKNDTWRNIMQGTNVLGISALTRRMASINPKVIFQLDAHSVVQYSATIPMLADDIRYMRSKTAIIIYAGKHAEQLQCDLQDLDIEAAIASSLEHAPMQGECLIIKESIARGFEDKEMGVIVYSEQDIYGRHKQKTKVARKKSTNAMDLFAELKIGDYVVHEKYGIGTFKGIETHTAGSVHKDFLMIEYSGGDRVGIATDDLNRVQKYIGSSEKIPKISKLNGTDWNRTVAKARASVKELAFDLVALYAKRQEKIGYAFSPDTIWQTQLEDAFPYEETPGQLRSLEEIKRDMESKRVMDRLLCGDVGYGKTEVALRAAFKAVQDSKQVAFLAPTTILVQQHFLTLSRRYEGFPIVVETLSRLRSSKQQKETLRRLKEGQVDILIGTHRLLGKDVEFADLGLLIVDEEQRFGVAHKEQIKNLKKDIDVLTLSATPIPRTLHMSMLGIRDMSVIDTPPEERYPVTTYVLEFSEQLLAEAIRKEMSHGGQVYILYNHVSNMERFASECQKIVPEANFAMAHGQMRQGELESIMLEFIDHQYDVLICSTIIESGVDIPNVNTLIVYDADRFGLSQLYQLRGRVGRSNRMAYAYFTFRQNKVINETAEKRLRAIRNFTEFGSGFKIAMQDLEIRGAGNLIGAQQHGRMDDVGYEYYCKLIAEAVEELRGDVIELRVDTQMDVSMDAFIPHDYIDQESQRLEMYKRIASIDTQETLYDVQEELEDRFGTIPEPVQRLLEISLLKSNANVAQIEQIMLREEEARLTFHEKTVLDMGVLLSVIDGETGWSFVPKAKTIQVRYKALGASVFDIFDQVNSMVSKICDCIHRVD